MILDYPIKKKRKTAKFFKRSVKVSLVLAAGAGIMSYLNHSELKTTDLSEVIAKKLEEQLKDSASLASLNNEEISSRGLTTTTISKGDTLLKVLYNAGISSQELHSVLTQPEAKPFLNLKPGQTLNIQTTEDEQLDSLSLEFAPGRTIHARRTESGFQIEHESLPVENRLAFRKGVIQHSLFGSAKKAGLDQKTIAQLIEIFGWNIDFALQLKPNDSFRVLYEEQYIGGEKINTGKIVAAELVTSGKSHQAVRFTDSGGSTSYFSPDGYRMQQAFLRTPVNFTRISSHFGTRNHPILHKIKHHKGVDYAAPVGTPIQSTAEGKVTYIGNRGGYGKVIEIQHGARFSTLYAHLSRFSKNLKYGSHVKQGQIIGFVGKSGLATGAHLHYEFKIDGIHRNPLTVTLPKRTPIADFNKPIFTAHAKKYINLLDMHEQQISFASNEFPLNE